MTGSYADSNDLLQQDRDFIVRARQLAYANDPATFNTSFFSPGRFHDQRSHLQRHQPATRPRVRWHRAEFDVHLFAGWLRRHQL
ncbi:MAG: hypothetical protein QM736_06290 [Vicinamibacterales bacterium]